MLDELNEYRRSKKRGALVLDQCLMQQALAHAVDVSEGARPHTDFNARLKRCGYGTGAENYSYGPNPLQRWQRSAGHRRNMLGLYTHCGFATYKGHTVLMLGRKNVGS